MKPLRIHIIGGSGSGKSFLAELLSNELDISCHDLDDIFWDAEAEFYNMKTEPEKRQEMLMDILSADSWIIEGVYHKWLEESFKAADIIILLKTNVYIRHWRICKRFFKRKMGLMSIKRKEDFRALLDLLKWNHGYDKRNLIGTEQMLEPYDDKVIIIKNRKETALFVKHYC